MHSIYENNKESVLIGTTSRFHEKLLHRFFDDIVDVVQDRIAVISEDDEQQITYMKLFEASNRFGRAIYNIFMSKTQEFNKFDDWIVAVHMKPSYHAIIIMLAAWKSGAAYLTLNRSLPNKRLKQILKEAKPQLIVTDETLSKFDCHDIFGDFQVLNYQDLAKLSRKLSSDYFYDNQKIIPTTLSSVNQTQDNTAIILYSSDPLSPPKGTLIYHNQCQQRLEWQWSTFPYQPDETHCISHNAIHHIDHFAEIWAPLFQGKSLIIMKEENHNDAAKIIDVMEKFNVARFYGLPSKINEILNILNESSVIHTDNDDKKGKRRLNNVNLWISSGNELKKDVAENFFKYYGNDGKHCLVNSYGCTETTGDCCYFIIKSLEHLQSLRRIPIGRPMTNTYIYVLNESEEIVERNVRGEIYVSGKLLADVYVENSDKSPYQINPFNSIPTYWNLFRTGDYGIVIDGQLCYDGRDKQKVRINDNEINLSSIENFINEKSYVDKALVRFICDNPVAFISLKQTHVNTVIEAIQNDFKNDLPVYAMPNIILIHHIPYLSNEQVDEDALIAKYNCGNSSQRGTQISVTIDLDEVPRDMHGIATKIFTILGKNIGSQLKGSLKATSNFFHIGGSSINVLTSISELESAGFYITTDDFLEAKNLLDILYRVEIISSRIGNDLSDHSMWIPSDWKIEVIKPDDCDECSKLLAECYYKKHALIKLDSNLKQENIQQFVENNWKYFINREWSFKVTDRFIKTIGVALNYEISDEKFLDLSEVKESKSIFEFERYITQKFLPRKYSDEVLLTNFMMGTSLTLSPNQNVRLVYMMEKRLVNQMIAADAKAIVSNEICQLKSSVCKLILGYETLKEFLLNRFIDDNGERPFKNADDNIIQFIQIYENENHK